MKKYILLITLTVGCLNAMDGDGSFEKVIALDSESDGSLSPYVKGYIESGESGESYDLGPAKSLSFQSDDSTLQLPSVGEVSVLEFVVGKPVSRDSLMKIMRENEEELRQGLQKEGMKVKLTCSPGINSGDSGVRQRLPTKLVLRRLTQE